MSMRMFISMSGVVAIRPERPHPEMRAMEVLDLVVGVGTYGICGTFARAVGKILKRCAAGPIYIICY